MELTKEYFDQKFGEQAEKFVTKEYFDKKFLDHTEYFDKKFDEQSKSLDKKFEENLEPIRNDIRDIKQDLGEVKELVQKIDKRDQEDANALAKSFVDHDTRLMKVEKMVGIKTIEPA